MAYFAQARFNVRCEWGLAAIDHLAQADVVIIVDVLSFTTTVDVALGRGVTVFPYRWRDNAATAYAAERDAELAGNRWGREDKYSLAPSSLVDAPAGLRLVLPSPNGSTLAFQAISSGAKVAAGSLRNAANVAVWAQASGGPITVIPAGERWPDGSLRPAIEDLIGAGAIISHLPGDRSPEADIAVAAFESVADRLFDRVLACASGREVAERGFERDIELATALDVSQAVPVLDDDAFASGE